MTFRSVALGVVQLKEPCQSHQHELRVSCIFASLVYLRFLIYQYKSTKARVGAAGQKQYMRKDVND